MEGQNWWIFSNFTKPQRKNAYTVYAIQVYDILHLWYSTGKLVHIISIILLIYDFTKAIIDSIRLYFDFIDDLLDLGFVSHDSLNNLNDFYMGKYCTEVFYQLRKSLELWKNLEEITAHFPNFDSEFFVEQTQKIQDIINDSRFDSWKEIWMLGQSCQQEFIFATECVDKIKTINLQAIIENHNKDFDGLRDDLSKG